MTLKSKLDNMRKMTVARMDMEGKVRDNKKYTKRGENLKIRKVKMCSDLQT